MDEGRALPPCPLRLPGAVKRVAGLSLVDAFMSAVIRDSEVMDAGRRLSNAPEGRGSPFIHTLERGSYPAGLLSWHWPIRYEEFSFTANLRISALLEAPSEPTREEAAVSRVLKDRYGAFIDLLRTGDVIAVGTSPGTGQRVEISHLEWSRAKMIIDIESGDLVESTRSGYVPRWTGIELTNGGAARAENLLMKNRGGRPERYAWDEVTDRLILRVGLKGIPSTQRELIEWIQELASGPGGMPPDEKTVRDFLTKRLPKLKEFVSKRE